MLGTKAEDGKGVASYLYRRDIRRQATKSTAAPKGVHITMAKGLSVVTYAPYKTPYRRLGNVVS